MEIGSCQVRIGGDVQNTVKKENITPAEILVLKRLHGDDSIIDVRIYPKERTPKDSEKRTSRNEVERLKKQYVERFTDNPDRPNVIKDLFPGAAPTLPEMFMEVMPEEQVRQETIEEVISRESKLREGQQTAA